MRHFFMMLCMSITVLSFTQCDMYMSAKRTKCALPKRALNIIDRSDSVIACKVDAMNAPSDTSETLCGYMVVGKAKSVGKHNAVNLQEIVDSLAIVGTQGHIKKFSTFIPDYGFVFYAGRSSVVLLVDQHADLCVFHYKKKQFLLDTDSVRNILEALLDDVWERKPTDKVKAENSVTQGVALDDNVAMAVSNPSKVENDYTPKAPQYIKLDENILKMIKSAQSVTCYIIDPLTKGDKDMERLGKYVVLQKKEVTDEKQVKSVSNLIASEKSFEKFDYVKNCTFLPDIALQINSGKKTLDILFSFYCNECMMLIDGKQVFRNDCSLIQLEIINIARHIYPKDKYLRTISK